MNSIGKWQNGIAMVLTKQIQIDHYMYVTLYNNMMNASTLIMKDIPFSVGGIDFIPLAARMYTPAIDGLGLPVNCMVRPLVDPASI